MGKSKVKQQAINLPASQKRELRSQFGAICYRVKDGTIQILLVTTRRTGRWMVPRGWPIDATTPAQTALREAWEEAGVRGKVTGNCVGVYSYIKELDDDDDLPCLVALFPVKVQDLEKSYPERKERKRRWFTPKKAAEKLDEPELSQIVKAFDPATKP